MATSAYVTLGDTFKLPDGPTVTVTEIELGFEHGEPVYYITGVNSLGQTVTRWIERSRAAV